MNSITTQEIRTIINRATNPAAAVAAILARCDALDKRVPKWETQVLDGLHAYSINELALRNRLKLRVIESPAGEITVLMFDESGKASKIVGKSPPFMLASDAVQWIEDNVKQTVPPLPKRRQTDGSRA